MLISFSVSNFRSFGEEVTLNMVASAKLNDHHDHLVPIDNTDKHVVRSAMLYGPNAAGKSNLIKAMDYAQRVIRSGSQTTIPLPDPFRFNHEWAQKPSSFEFRFLAAGQVYTFGFDIHRTGIHSEWLTATRGTKEKVVFERDATGQTSIGDAPKAFFADDTQMHHVLPVLAKLPMKSNQLFISRVNSLPSESIGEKMKHVLQWLTEDLLILEAEARSCDMLERLHSDSRFKSFAESFLCNVDTGICTLEINEQFRDADEHERALLQHYADELDFPYLRYGCSGDFDERLDPNNPTRVIMRRLMSVHQDLDKPGVKHHLPFAQESDGTQQLLHYLPYLHPDKGRSRVVVIDELDRSLHPSLCVELIRFFSESCPGAHRQMIVTTHEAHLLDQDLLRRDEYWMVQKEQNGQSRLTPLTDFKIRKDLNLRKGYLQGRFDALPIIGDISSLAEWLGCTTDGVDYAEKNS